MKPRTLPLLTKDHKAVYRDIRNFLAGRFLGATRDETLLEEFIKCLFCKFHILRNELILDEGGAQAVSRLYRDVFQILRSRVQGIFAEDDEIILDPASIAFVDEQLDRIDLLNPSRDPVGDAYEVFIGSVIRGQEGQFFTPRNAVNLLVSLVDPQPGEKIIDPACGAGSFLNETAKYLVDRGVSEDNAITSVLGIDKDSYLVRLARLRIAALDGHPPQIYRADSLAWDNGEDQFPLRDTLGTYDVVLTNPPFGSRIIAASDKIKKQFELGYQWKKSRENKDLERTNILKNKCPPQVLFVERCISVVRPGGRIGMVVPESLISSKTYRHVVQFIRKHTEIKAVIGMPEPLFKISGKAGTHTKTCLISLVKKGGKNQHQKQLFMAEAKWCGHDSRGRPLEHDDLPAIAEKYREWQTSQFLSPSHLGYAIQDHELHNGILAPHYYNPEIYSELEKLRSTHELIQMGDLIAQGIVSIHTGDEIGKLAYGTGPIPFVRTSDISNWEIKVDPKHRVSEEIYESLKEKQDVRPGDILMVKDGTYLIGTCALLTEHNAKIVYQSHLYKLRVNDNSLGITPYLLIAVLSSPIVKKQILLKRLTQDIIDSLGQRVNELILPISRLENKRKQISEMVERAIDLKSNARELATNACQLVQQG